MLNRKLDTYYFRWSGLGNQVGMEGEAKPNLVDRDVVYNFEQERELLMMISCYKVSKSSKLNHFLSLSYVSIVWLFVLFELCMGLYSVVLTIDSPKTQLLETLHTVVLTFYVIAHMTNRLQSGFDAALEIINKGFYTYDENMGETHYEIRKEYVRRIRLVNKWFRIIIIYSGISFLMFNTAKKYLENVYKTEPSKIPINPYFPIPYFMPFDTSTVVTFTSAYLLNVALEFFICSVTICIDEIYVSLIEQLKAQFVILNLSISNIVERALRRYQDGKAVSVPNVEELYQQKEFQDCVLQCLKENIRHHHALLRFTALIRNYVQRTFFLVVITGGLALALAVLVITKSKLTDQELLGVGTFLMMLLTELVFILQFCLYGEEISNESGKLFISLWSTPWWNFDKRVKLVLSIMMLNTKKPIIFKTSFLNVSSSLESFSNIISSAYQMGNVMLNM